MAGASPAAKHATAVSRNHHGHCGSPRGERAGPSDQCVTWKSPRGPRGQHVEGAGTSNLHVSVGWVCESHRAALEEGALRGHGLRNGLGKAIALSGSELSFQAGRVGAVV